MKIVDVPVLIMLEDGGNEALGLLVLVIFVKVLSHDFVGVITFVLFTKSLTVADTIKWLLRMDA